MGGAVGGGCSQKQRREQESRISNRGLDIRGKCVNSFFSQLVFP